MDTTNPGENSGARCLLWPSSVVVLQPAFEQCDRRAEVVAQRLQKVDVVEIPLTGEAVPNQIVVAFVAEFELYEPVSRNELFPEFPGTLEKANAMTRSPLARVVTIQPREELRCEVFAAAVEFRAASASVREVQPPSGSRSRGSRSICAQRVAS